MTIAAARANRLSPAIKKGAFRKVPQIIKRVTKWQQSIFTAAGTAFTATTQTAVSMYAALNPTAAENLKLHDRIRKLEERMNLVLAEKKIPIAAVVAAIAPGISSRTRSKQPASRKHHRPPTRTASQTKTRSVCANKKPSVEQLAQALKQRSVKPVAKRGYVQKPSVAQLASVGLIKISTAPSRSSKISTRATSRPSAAMLATVTLRKAPVNKPAKTSQSTHPLNPRYE
jgi:hypothetical protein